MSAVVSKAYDTFVFHLDWRLLNIIYSTFIVIAYIFLLFSHNVILLAAVY